MRKTYTPSHLQKSHILQGKAAWMVRAPIYPCVCVECVRFVYSQQYGTDSNFSWLGKPAKVLAVYIAGLFLTFTVYPGKRYALNWLIHGLNLDVNLQIMFFWWLSGKRMRNMIGDFVECHWNFDTVYVHDPHQKGGAACCVWLYVSAQHPYSTHPALNIYMLVLPGTYCRCLIVFCCCQL